MALTPQQALDMINRSAITGVPTSEFDAAGGYDAVYSLAQQAGWNGAPSQSAIAQYGQQVADTGVGNWAYAPAPTTQSVDKMVANGIGLDSIYNIVQGFNNGTMGSTYANAMQQTQQPSWMGQWQTMQDQFNQMMQGWQTQQQTQQPSYGYNGSNTSYNYQPVYSNPLMRPVTANSNIAPQQAPSNMGYQNRTTLWGDV